MRWVFVAKRFILVMVLACSTADIAYAQAAPLFTLEDCKTLTRIDAFFEAKEYHSVLRCIDKLHQSRSILKDSRVLHLKAFHCYKHTDIDSAYYHLSLALDYGLRCMNAPCDIPADFLIFDSVRNRHLRRAYFENSGVAKDSFLINKINRLIVRDQTARGNEQYFDTSIYQLGHTARYIDSINLIELKKIVYKYGWPGYFVLGTKGDTDLWGLVQHADEDVAFQMYVLQLIAGKVLLNHTRRENYAYLYDRICVNLGRPQLFGTQAKIARKDAFELHELQDAANVDYYRKAFGLSSLDSYIRFFKKKMDVD